MRLSTRLPTPSAQARAGSTQAFIQFCDHYDLCFIDQDASTMCLFITHCLSSVRSVRNYVSGVRTRHKELGLTPAALESFQVSSMLRAVDIAMRTPPLRRLPILPTLHSLCTINSILRSLGPALPVCLLPLHVTVTPRQTSASVTVSQPHELPGIFCPDHPQTVWLPVADNPCVSDQTAHSCLVSVSDTNHSVSAQTIQILSGVSVGYPHPLYISYRLPRPPTYCLVLVSDMFILFCGSLVYS